MLVSSDSDAGETFLREEIYSEADSQLMVLPSICPGMHLADASVWIAIASLLATVDVTKAVGEDGAEITPDPAFTLGTSMCCPFRLCFEAFLIYLCVAVPSRSSARYDLVQRKRRVWSWMICEDTRCISVQCMSPVSARADAVNSQIPIYVT